MIRKGKKRNWVKFILKGQKGQIETILKGYDKDIYLHEKDILRKNLRSLNFILENWGH